jgi:hypothetical protein
MPMHLGALLVACGLTISQPTAPAPAVSPPAPLQLRNLHQQTAAVLRKRAKTYYRMPDGSVWDGWACAESRAAIDKAIRQVEIKRQDGLHVETIRRELQVVDKQLASKWRLSSDSMDSVFLASGSTCATGGTDGGPRYWYNAKAAANDDPLPFIFVEDAAKVPRAIGARSSFFTFRVSQAFANGVYAVHGTRGMAVRLDSPSRLKGEELVGTYFLLPDESVTPPDAGDSNRYRGYRVIDADALRLTPEALLEAIQKKETVLYEWVYARHEPAESRSGRNERFPSCRDL